MAVIRRIEAGGWCTKSGQRGGARLRRQRGDGGTQQAPDGAVRFAGQQHSGAAAELTSDERARARLRTQQGTVTRVPDSLQPLSESPRMLMLILIIKRIEEDLKRT